MDALALLCTLYAEGPSTLQRLRSGGCDSLAILLESDPAGLRERLGWDERLSERFLREAWILAERLDVGWSDDEAIDGPKPSEAAPKPQVAVPSESAQARSRAKVRPTLRDKLLERWRELDRDEPPADLDLRPADIPSRRPSSVGAEDMGAARARTRIPEGEAQGVDTEQLELLGLTPQEISRLGAKGVVTLRAFAEYETLALAGLLGLPYTRAQRRQLQAKQLERAGAAAPAKDGEDGTPAPAAPDHSGIARPRSEPPPEPSSLPQGPDDSQLDAAGPFA